MFTQKTGIQYVSHAQNNQLARTFKIGSYDSGLFDQADDVQLKRKLTFNTKAEALSYAQNQQGTEFILQRKDEAGTLQFDVFAMTVKDPDSELNTLKDIENLQLMDRPLHHIEKNTSVKHALKGFIVTGSGQVSKPIYKQDFARTTYDKIRETFDLDTSKFWRNFVNTQMSAPSSADDLAAIDNQEINHMVERLQPGDIIMNGNNGSFVHGILFVGKDAELQAKLEHQWQLAPGTLDNDNMIMHSLAVDSTKEVDGVTYQRGGSGPIIDTLEQYLKRHPRDVMIAVTPRNANETDRQNAIENGKQLIGRPYDTGFNTFDDSHIYCTEFIMKSWMDSNNSPDLKMQQYPLAPMPGIVTSILPDRWSKAMKDDGILHQEMLLPDGILASPSVDIIWASQNADQSEFIAKHQRYADGLAGNINGNYQEMVKETLPEVSTQSQRIIDSVNRLSAETRSAFKPE